MSAAIDCGLDRQYVLSHVLFEGGWVHARDARDMVAHYVVGSARDVLARRKGAAAQLRNDLAAYDRAAEAVYAWYVVRSRVLTARAES